ncbi:MAG: TetR/AcrR family transcriptional regulator C-terminal domain-containing protein [Clostridia bacterium]|nr:TetR/AcrR family transcriptional regulator C-terminal domain-containing protein [Clostridia bacterium]
MSNLAKEAIINSFLNELNKKPLDKITVKNITDGCGLTRNTFYYHFRDVYALLDYIFQREVEDVRLKPGEKLESIEENLRNSLKFINNNRRAIYHLYNSLDKNKLDRYLNAVLLNAVVDQIEMESKDLDISDFDKELLSKFLSRGFVGLISDWVENGMDNEAFELAIGRITVMFDQGLEDILQRCQENKMA